jgi:DnaK suppressor protein
VKGTYIVNTDLEHIRQTLELHLKRATSTHELSDSIRIQQVADPADMTQDAVERDIAVQILDRESALARRIRAAIDRISDGSYGACVDCEEEIAPKRLNAVPWAERCISCQERADRSLGEGAPAFEFKAAEAA